MNCDLCSYRARVGCYHAKAAALGHKLSFLDRSKYFVLFSFSFVFNRRIGSHWLRLHTCLSNVLPHDAFEQPAVRDTLKAHSEGFFSSAIIDITSCTLVALQKLLSRSGDVEANPGPNTSGTNFWSIHLDARSIKNRIDLTEAEAGQFDAINVSETWLFRTDINNSIHLTNYHPPIRRDRLNDPIGGIAIYSPSRIR